MRTSYRFSHCVSVSKVTYDVIILMVHIMSVLCVKWSSITFAARRKDVARGRVKGLHGS